MSNVDTWLATPYEDGGPVCDDCCSPVPAGERWCPSCDAGHCQVCGARLAEGELEAWLCARCVGEWH
jgi:hypothetical protein